MHSDWRTLGCSNQTLIHKEFTDESYIDNKYHMGYHFVFSYFFFTACECFEVCWEVRFWKQIRTNIHVYVIYDICLCITKTSTQWAKVFILYIKRVSCLTGVWSKLHYWHFNQIIRERDFNAPQACWYWRALMHYINWFAYNHCLCGSGLQCFCKNHDKNIMLEILFIK